MSDWLSGSLIGSLSGWLVGWLVGWLIGWLVGESVGYWLVGWLVGGWDLHLSFFLSFIFLFSCVIHINSLYKTGFDTLAC